MKNFKITGMHCAGCVASVERNVKQLEGCSEVYVNFATSRLSLQIDESVCSSEAVIAAIEKSGFKAIEELDDSFDPAFDPGEEEQGAKLEFFKLIFALIFSALLSVFAMRGMIPFFPELTISPRLDALVQIILLLPILFIGRSLYRSGFAGLFRLAANMDTLIAVGTAAAIIYSIFMIATSPADLEVHLYFETAGMIIAVILLGRFLEGRARRKASSTVKQLLALQPANALLVKSDGTEVITPVKELKSGDILRVKPGEKIPIDGLIVEGLTSIDESMLSGESIPVDKKPGDEVTGASINQHGAILIKVTNVGKETVLAKIVQLVEEAQGARPPIARLADIISGFFVWVVLGIALFTFLSWFFFSAEGFKGALQFSLAVLVIACPCALGLATPIALVVGLGRGAGLGILIKSGAALEKACKIETIIFDKTGTLTEGKPKLEKIVKTKSCQYNEEELLQIAASAEKSSEHPLAAAIVLAANEKALKLLEVSDFQALPGFGVSCKLADKALLLGNLRLLEERGISVPGEILHEARGSSAVLLAENNEFLALLAIKDQARGESAATLQRLKAMGMRTVMLSGDRPEAAEVLAEELGIDEVFAGLLPADKVSKIVELKKAAPDKIIAMVGDGINDAPALAQADIGIAIGGGTDIAMESADIILMNSTLKDVSKSIELSKKTMRIIKENLFWALSYNLVGIPLAAGLFYAAFNGPVLHPVFGAAAMAGSSVAVVLNALRLRSFGK